MTLGHVPVCLVTLTVAAQLSPEPVQPDGTRPINLFRAAGWGWQELRLRAEAAALRGRPDQREEHAGTLADLGVVQTLARRPAALDTWLAAYRAQADLEPDDAAAGSAAHNLAVQYCDRGRFAEAERYFAVAWRVDRRRGRDDNQDRAQWFSQLARLYEGAGRYDLAAWCAGRAVRLRGEPFLRVAGDHATLARVALRTGRLDAARAAVETAEQYQPDHVGVRLVKARVLVAARDDRAARRILIDLADEAPSRHWVNRGLLADIRVVLAGVATRAGDPDRGQLLLRSAIDTYARQNGPRCPDYIDAVAEYERLFPDDREEVAEHVAAIRAAAVYEELLGPDAVRGG